MTETYLLVLAVTLRIVSNPVGNVFQKQLTSEGRHPLVVNFLTYLLLSLVCIVLYYFTESKALSSAFWIYSLLAGLAGALGNGFLVKALQMGDLSVIGPINAYKSVIGIVFAIFLLQEIPGFFALTGIVLIIAGSYFILGTGGGKLSADIFKRPEIRFRIAAMVLSAIEAVFIKIIIQASSTLTGFISWCVFGTLFSFLFLLVSRVALASEIRKLRLADGQSFLLLIICIGTMQLSTNYAFDHMPVGYALSLFQLSAILSVWLGYRIFQEQEIRRKMLGSCIMLVGSVLIILTK